MPENSLKIKAFEYLSLRHLFIKKNSKIFVFNWVNEKPEKVSLIKKS